MREGWKYKKLGEVAKISSGKAIPSSEILDTFSEGLYPCYGGNGLRGYVGHYSNDGLIPVIGRVGALCGNVHLPQGKFYATEHALVVYLKTNDQPHYLEYLLSSLNLRQYAKGVAQPVLSASTLSEIPIPIPSLAEQKRIVSELDLLSGIIEKKKAQLKELDNLAQSIFYDMFGDPVTNEKGWEVKKLGEVCTDIKYGTSKPACDNGKYKYLRMGNISINGELDLTDLKTIDIPDEEVEKYIVRFGDILFNRTNSLDLIGKTCMFNLDEPMIIAGYIIRVKLSDRVSPRYIAKMFNLPSMKLLLKKMAKGAVNQANINSKELASIAIPLPPLSLQQSFAEKIEAIEQQKSLVQQSITEVETLFNSRMDYYFD